MKLSLSHFIIAILIFSLFYLTIHLSFMEGSLFERKNKICAGTLEIAKIQESQRFSENIFKLQQGEIKNYQDKIEQGIKNLSACEKKNFKLQTDYNKILTPAE